MNSENLLPLPWNAGIKGVCSYAQVLILVAKTNTSISLIKANTSISLEGKFASILMNSKTILCMKKLFYILMSLAISECLIGILYISMLLTA